MRSSDKIRDNGLLKHFQLNTCPFSPDPGHFRFFEIFHMDPVRPFSFDQTMVYVQFLLNAAGPDHQIVIKEEVHEVLYHLSEGRAGEISRLMDRALRRAFAERTQVISPRHIEDTGEEEAVVDDAAFEESAAEDVNRERPKMEKGAKTSPPGKAVSIIITAVLLLGLAGGAAWLAGNNLQGSALEEKTPPATPVTRETQHPAPETSTPSKPTDVPVPENKEDKQTGHTDDPVANFLAAYNLQAYEQPFSKALFKENFDAFTRQTYNETGLMLIHFTTYPENFRKKYRILDKLLINPLHRRYFLFWKPDPVIRTWEYGTGGKPVRQVQAMLKKIGLYPGGIDGTVGVELTRALIRFQRQHDLEQTGVPDPTTLFFLTALSR